MNAVQSDEGFREFEPKVVAADRPRFGEIAAAFAKAQLEMRNPVFDSANPFFKSQFASLAAVRNAVVPLLAKHGICMAQDLTTAEGTISCATILTHCSGQQMTFGPLTLPVSKADAQGYAAAGTYAKRIALQSVCGVVGDSDDDGESAAGRNGKDSAKGDLGKHVPPDQYMKAAATMRDIMEMDVEEPVKVLRVLDYHDVLNKDSDLYVAAADELGSKLKNAWKTYVSMAKAAQKADQNVANAGKRW